MNKRHIVFDVDGTLIDTEYAVLHSLQDTLNILAGKTAPIQTLSFVLGITGEDALEQLGIREKEAFLARWNEKMEDYSHTVSVFAGIEPVLQALLDKGYGLGIVTSKTREEFQREFCRFSIHSCFQTVVCADDTHRHKPDPQPLEQYGIVAGCSREEMLYIGDSVYDRQCAQAAGVDFALAGWGAQARMDGVWHLQVPADILTAVNEWEVRQ